MSFPTDKDLKDLQGDVVLGFPKRVEDFFFIEIKDAAGFKKALKDLKPLITSTADIQKLRKDIADHKQSNSKDVLLKAVGTNIAFSAAGLLKLGIDTIHPIKDSNPNPDYLNDDIFGSGQINDAESLGDTGKKSSDNKFVPDWLDGFKKEIHGLILVAADSVETLNEQKNKIDLVLGKTIGPILTVEGRVLTDKGHEHFGFLDGISSPAIVKLTGQLPGQPVVRPGVLVLGQEGDARQRPSWAKNGSFLAYRHLEQLVPEFHKFLADNPLTETPDRKLGSELLGARMFGRWKSGAPTVLSPTKDDPELGADPQRNNNFDFSKDKTQTLCPFSAHIRKTNPRSDLPPNDAHEIMRQGIPFGPEVTAQESGAGKTAINVSRGLAFVCYQSALDNGFSFMQKIWVNNTMFPPKGVEVGFDPIIGTNGGNPSGRKTFGLDPKAQSESKTLPIEWVVPKGGEYFFSPPISALTDKLAAA